mmetsp:Transcript_3053/g.8631  ORF Transcript_3053/g.8631 Transcript_3053/m.8631 type:complete len:171 (-) Transcript_3053:949-1461(-)
MRYQLIQILLRHGADPNFCASDGTSILHNACRRCGFEVVETLVQHGASVHSKDCKGESTLHAACQRVGVQDIVRFLLQQGASPNGRCRAGFTPSHLACKQPRRGNGSVVHTLRAFGADVTISCARGYPPISFAANNLNTEVVQNIWSRGIFKCRLPPILDFEYVALCAPL